MKKTVSHSNKELQVIRYTDKNGVLVIKVKVK